MAGFMEFCKKLATNNVLSITTPDDPNVVEIPFNLENDITTLVNALKPKMNRLDKIHITYIEACFNDMNRINEILESQYGYDIDDGIPYALSRYLYDIPFNDLDVDRQSIIKVLTVYILVQNYIS
jgi:hypothetical protein